MAAKMAIMATTIKSSINVKPLFLIFFFLSFHLRGFLLRGLMLSFSPLLCQKFLWPFSWVLEPRGRRRRDAKGALSRKPGKGKGRRVSK
jgi:hypothetical protein